MKKFILIAALILTVFGISYGIASAVNGTQVTAHACEENTCA